MLYLSYRLDEGQRADAEWPPARSLRTLCEASVEAFERNPLKSMIVRYHYAQRVLRSLQEVEEKALLPCFACRAEECDQLRWYEAIFIATHAPNDPEMISSIHETAVGLLPPAAMELIRMQTNLRLKSVKNDKNPDSSVALYTFPTNFSSIGLLLSSVLSRVAIPKPVLKDLYTLAEALKDQAEHDINTSTVPQAFSDATMNPIPTFCAPTKRRAISIQREFTQKRKSVSSQRFITPILERVEEFLKHLKERGSTPTFSESSLSITSGGANLAMRQQRGVRTVPHPEICFQSRATINLTNKEETGNSPSPSAERPGRR
ncbi:unnamed protein product, partial [Phytomonas sp. Hart1]